MVKHINGFEDPIVSNEADNLIVVDDSDREIGNLSKAVCHDGDGVLHRAFSLFIFNRSGQLLIQKRSAKKRLWPLFWSNSCCSHPRDGEDMEEVIHRRLYEELRICSDLEYLYKFQYHARFGDIGSEHELCWVYSGISDDEIQINHHEIADWKFIPPETLDYLIDFNPERFTPWFRLEWTEVKHRLEQSYK